MRGFTWALSLAVVASLGLARPAAADAPLSALGIGVRAGTLGGGLEVVTPLLPKLNVRGAINAASYSYDTDYAGNDYEFDLSLLTFGGLLDYHLLDGGFRVTGGLLLNGNGLDAVAIPGEAAGDDLTFEIGGQIYDASAEVQAFTGEIEFGSVAPYAGLGWGNPIGWDKQWGLTLDVGFMFQGSPSITMDTIDTLDDTTPVPGDAQGRTPKQILRDNVDEEVAELEEDVSAFDMYPVLSLGLTYRFY